MKFSVSVVSASVLAVAAALSASAAMAQPRWGEPAYVQGLPMRVVMDAVRARGLRPVARPRLRDRHYVVPAVDRAGRPQRVVIDAGSGRIVRVQAMGPAPDRFAREREYAMRGPGPDRGGPPPDEMDDYQGRFAPPPGELPPPRPRAAMPDAGPGEPSAMPRRPLPPLRPRASLSTEPPDVGAPPHGALPAPPEQRTAKPAKPPMPRPRPADTAAVTPAAPAPAESPASAPAAAAAPEQSEGSAGTQQPEATPRSKPRVVLPGGPVPRSERTAASGGPAAAPAPEAAPATTESIPAQKPAEAPAAAPGADAIPPAQTYE